MWEKLWQNLRSTREKEFLFENAIHLVAAWIGNSPTIP
jgi:hypothetical protein